MDKMRAEGAGQKIGGRVKEAAGKLTGDTKLQAEGRADKTVGGIKNAVGGAADAVRDAGRKKH
ncbi:MAG: CsbD family protein [Caulobacteraceae bacterium]|nr:CsbD family protein [Caulobacteraceae bacterium]